MFSETLGCLAALGSAAAWAISSILFQKAGKDVSPAGILLGCGSIGVLYMGIALLPGGLGPVEARTFLVLGLSGILGLTVGGVLFFRALMYLGPKLTVIMGLVCPVLTIVLAVILLRERPSPAAWFGSIMTLAGISLVMWKKFPPEDRARAVPGVIYSLLSALCTAFSIILAKIGVADIPAMEASFIRHLWAMAGLVVWGLVTRRIKDWLAPFKERSLVYLILFSGFIVIFGGFWLSMVSLKFLDVSIATTLSMTEPLFILPLTAFLLKEKVSAREIAGSLIAFSGVALIFLR